MHCENQVALTLALTRILGRLFSYLHQPQVSSSILKMLCGLRTQSVCDSHAAAGSCLTGTA